MILFPLLLSTTVVLGGTLEAVRAALAAKARGREVVVYAPRPYLGEDRAGTYDLARRAGDDPNDPLVREIFNPAYGADDAYAVRKGMDGWHACDRIAPFSNRVVSVSSSRLADRTTPFLVKRALDRALLAAGIKFVTGAVVVGTDDRGVRLATRNGVKSVPAEEVIDCRLRRPLVPGEYVCAWNVVRGREHPRVETVETPIRLESVTPRALAKAESLARDRIFRKDLLDFAPFPKWRLKGENPARGTSCRTATDAMAADVVVVGGGTAGAPAAIAAARQGAKVVVVEFMNVLGGVTTEGRICGYYHGNVCGFTAELDRGMKDLADVPWIAKGEWYRRELSRCGAEILFGAFGCGVAKTGSRVTGVRVAFSDGSTSEISCKVVIDATGNCDVAAAAGCETDFISADELSLQGAGVAPQTLGISGLNSDIGFVDETSTEDISGFLLRTRLSLPDRVWNVSQMADSRERRRLVGVFRLMPSDILSGRTYRDTIGETTSNFDTHGQTASDVFFVRSPGKRGDIHHAQVPYRCLLPKDVDGLLVTGLGVSAHRDAMPVLRMQPDVQNVGYAAGMAAAMAVERNCTPRQIDVKELQCHLVARGNLASHVLSDADQPRAETPVFREGDCAALLAQLKASSWDGGWNFKGMSQFGRSVSEVDRLMIALGKCRYAPAVDELVRKSAALTADDAYSHFRALALAAEGCAASAEGRRRLAKSLHRLLALSGIGGHSRERPEPIPGFREESADTERTLVLRELVLARALYRLGDCEGLGRRTLAAYRSDFRGAYAHHARLVLKPVEP